MTMIKDISMALILLLPASGQILSQPPIILYGASKPASYELHAGDPDNPNSYAEVCFAIEGDSNNHCLQAGEGKNRFFDSPQINFSPFPMGERTQIGLFSATQNFGGSGTALWLAALVYNPSSAMLENLLPSIVLSRQGDHQMWFDRVVSRFPLLSIGEFTSVPDATVEGEHKYHIQTFYFDSATGRYRQLDSYTTRKAYNIFGTPIPISVLEKEKPTIKARAERKARAILR
jgi:hypothetical protein